MMEEEKEHKEHTERRQRLRITLTQAVVTTDKLINSLWRLQGIGAAVSPSTTGLWTAILSGVFH